VKWNKVISSEECSQPLALEEGIPRVEPAEVSNTIFVVILEDKYELSDKIRFGLFRRPSLDDKSENLDIFLINIRDSFHLNDKFKYIFTRYGKQVQDLDHIKSYDRVLLLCKIFLPWPISY